MACPQLLPLFLCCSISVFWCVSSALSLLSPPAVCLLVYLYFKVYVPSFLDEIPELHMWLLVLTLTQISGQRKNVALQDLVVMTRDCLLPWQWPPPAQYFGHSPQKGCYLLWRELLETQSNPQMTFQMHLVVKVHTCHALASPQGQALFSDCKTSCICACIFPGSCTFKSILTSSWRFNGWAIYMHVNSRKCALTNNIGPSALTKTPWLSCDGLFPKATTNWCRKEMSLGQHPCWKSVAMLMHKPHWLQMQPLGMLPMTQATQLGFDLHKHTDND